MKTVKVNPGKGPDGRPLKVFKETMVEIKHTSEGTVVPRTAFYNRLIKNKDLVIVADVETPIFKKAAENKKATETETPKKKSKGTKKQKTNKSEE